MVDKLPQKENCREHCDAHIWVEERGNLLDKKIASVCSDVKSAHSRVDKKIGQGLFTWVIGGICTAFVLSMTVLIYQFSEQQKMTISQFAIVADTASKMDNKLNILVYQVSQIEKRTENISK